MTDPALTAEEWATKQTAESCIMDGVLFISDDDWEWRGIENGKQRHAIAALALYGQPFGFTHEDVRNLRGWADKTVEVATDDGDWDNMDTHDDAERRAMYAVADKIAALLPPEGT